MDNEKSAEDYTEKRLNIGCGHKILKDCINVDVTPYAGVDQVVDLASYPWPWEDGSIDGIHASHVIEHLEDPVKFINECRRILKVGGFLRLCLPHSSSCTNVGCFGHYRTFSYNTMDGYLGRDFYMFGKAPFLTVERKLRWWFEYVDGQGELPPGCETVIRAVDWVITGMANIFPRLWENIICPTIQMREVIWKGIKL